MTNKIHIFYNAKCVNCQAIEEEMRRVGSITFCPRCCDNNFISDDPVRKERKTYLKFLDIQNRKVLEEDRCIPENCDAVPKGKSCIHYNKGKCA